MNRSPLPAKVLPQSLWSTIQPAWPEPRSLPDSCPPREDLAARNFFAPIHYEPGYAYPLVVWLHGHASNEQEVQQVMPLVSMRNYVAVAPRGADAVANVPGAYHWSESPHHIAAARNRVLESIEAAKERFSIHPQRIFVAGYASGGTMALRLGLEQPEDFAGAISLGGRLPSGGCPLNRLNDLRDLPLLLSVSPDQPSPEESTYSLQQVLADVKLLHFAGASLSLRLYPEGDRLTTVMLSDVDNWMMQLVCPAPAPVAS